VPAASTLEICLGGRARSCVRCTRTRPMRGADVLICLGMRPTSLWSASGMSAYAMAGPDVGRAPTRRLVATSLTKKGQLCSTPTQPTVAIVHRPAPAPTTRRRSDNVADSHLVTQIVDDQADTCRAAPGTTRQPLAVVPQAPLARRQDVHVQVQPKSSAIDNGRRPDAAGCYGLRCVRGGRMRRGCHAI
jgi:hypothetical protein